MVLAIVQPHPARAASAPYAWSCYAASERTFYLSVTSQASAPTWYGVLGSGKAFDGLDMGRFQPGQNKIARLVKWPAGQIGIIERRGVSWLATGVRVDLNIDNLCRKAQG